jgi:hypothetical protein
VQLTWLLTKRIVQFLTTQDRVRQEMCRDCQGAREIDLILKSVSSLDERVYSKSCGLGALAWGDTGPTFPVLSLDVVLYSSVDDIFSPKDTKITKFADLFGYGCDDFAYYRQFNRKLVVKTININYSEYSQY